MNAKPLFWETEGNLETFQKVCSYGAIYYKLILESAKSLNQIF